LNENEKIGALDFKKTKAQKEKDRSPSKKTKSKEEIQARINFCEHELKIHRNNGNNRMIGFKLEEITDLKKKLK